MRILPDMRSWNRGFFRGPYQDWQATIHRGEDGERGEEGELIFAAVSQANLASFCVALHRESAVQRLSEAHVGQALDDPERRSLSPARRAVLEFAERLTRTPDQICREQVGRALDAGASLDRLRAAVEIAAVTNVMNRMTTTTGSRPPAFIPSRRVPREVRKRRPAFFDRPYWAWEVAVDRRWPERELVTTAVSQTNLASFCVGWHRPRAVAQLSEEEVGQALAEGERGLLAPDRRALLEFAEQLTRAPEELSAEDVARAIDAGASIDELRDVAEITAQTNAMNRITTTLEYGR